MIVTFHFGEEAIFLNKIMPVFITISKTVTITIFNNV